MKIKGIPIIKVATGETRIYSVGDEYDYPDDTLKFSWQENNFSCDCNRHSAFERVLNPEYVDDDYGDDGFPCGDTAYRVPYIELENGTKILIDDDPELK